jgi:predicted permease
VAFLKNRKEIIMFTTFYATLTPMLMLFLCMILGFVCKKTKITPDNTATVLSKLENYILVPALIIHTFMTYCNVASIRAQYKLILYSALALAIALAIAFPLSRAFAGKDAYRRNIYKYALTFGNFSFMGNAIVPAIMGEEALYYYMLYILPLNIAVYTWGVIILIPREAKAREDGQAPSLIKAAMKNLLNPIFISILVGVVLGLCNVKPFLERNVPFVTNTVSSLAACMGPLAMVLTGFVIGGYRLPTLMKNGRVYLASALRLIVLPILFIAVLYFLGADKMTLLLTMFAFGTPLGLNTVVFPAAYGGDTACGASMAMISHTLCVVTIPLLYTVLTRII